MESCEWALLINFNLEASDLFMCDPESTIALKENILRPTGSDFTTLE